MFLMGNAGADINMPDDEVIGGEQDWECPMPGMKIRSRGQGRGMGPNAYMRNMGDLLEPVEYSVPDSGSALYDPTSLMPSGLKPWSTGGTVGQAPATRTVMKVVKYTAIVGAVLLSLGVYGYYKTKV